MTFRDVERVMEADTSSMLSQIEARITGLARPTARLLNPGIDPTAVRALLARRGLEPPDDLVVLWHWKNGTTTSTDATLGEMWLVPGFYLLSVEDAALNFDAFVRDSRWRPDWLPVFADGGGDFLAVNCALGDEHGEVHHFRIEQSEHPLEYRSIERMIATFAAAFDRGAFYVDRDGYLEEDADAYASIAAELNPDLGWWTDPVT